MPKPVLRQGEPDSGPPAINFWVEVVGDKVYLSAKHSDDDRQQLLLMLDLSEPVPTVETRNLFPDNLCVALGVERSHSLPVRREGRPDAAA